MSLQESTVDLQQLSRIIITATDGVPLGHFLLRLSDVVYFLPAGPAPQGLSFQIPHTFASHPPGENMQGKLK